VTGSRFTRHRGPEARGAPHSGQTGSGSRVESRDLTPGHGVSGRQRCREIVLTPPSDGNHQVIVGGIISQVILKSAAEIAFSCYRGLIVPDTRVTGAGRWFVASVRVQVRVVSDTDAPRSVVTVAEKIEKIG
jgi:hypothetical protein